MGKNTKHEKKPLPSKANRFIRHVFPSNYFSRLNKAFGLDANKEKLFFRSFAIFIIVAVILQPQDTSLRDLSALSSEKGMQRLTGWKRFLFMFGILTHDGSMKPTLFPT